MYSYSILLQSATIRLAFNSRASSAFRASVTLMNSATLSRAASFISGLSFITSRPKVELIC